MGGRKSLLFIQSVDCNKESNFNTNDRFTNNVIYWLHVISPTFSFSFLSSHSSILSSCVVYNYSATTSVWAIANCAGAVKWTVVQKQCNIMQRMQILMHFIDAEEKLFLKTRWSVCVGGHTCVLLKHVHHKDIFHSLVSMWEPGNFPQFKNSTKRVDAEEHDLPF